jgi:drug/metabolite transporter (DMT)-like permease
MLAIAGGLGAAFSFAAVTLCNSRSARMIGAPHLLAWIMLIGLVITLPLAAFEGIPDGLDGEAFFWMGVAGAGNVVGLLLAYSALRVGKVSVVAPIVSTQGAIAALIAVLAGETLSPEVAILLVVIGAGVVLSGRATGAEEPAQRQSARATFFALGAAIAIGGSLYATGRVGIELPLQWALLPSRVLGVAGVSIPLWVASRPRITRAALPLVLTSGVLEVAGFASFAFGARHSIAISAVLSSQFAAFAAASGFLLFRERLSPAQLAGVAVIGVGVGALAAIQA